MSRFIDFDPRFCDLLKPEATLEQLATGAIWSEGPVYFHEDDSVIWSFLQLQEHPVTFRASDDHRSFTSGASKTGQALIRRVRANVNLA